VYYKYEKINKAQSNKKKVQAPILKYRHMQLQMANTSLQLNGLSKKSKC